ncbi:MAG TPA: sensor histidine kinase [Candidatus Binatia bacterium]|nr:sensor histidine kinase [Candidatus Binatia bacterium]
MSILFRLTNLSLGCFFGGLSCSLAIEGLASGDTNQLLEIRSLSVNGQPVSMRPGRKLRLSSAPRNVAFGFGTAANSPRAPLRLRYTLDGFEDTWREVSSDMSISFRFIDANQDPVSEKVFRAVGQTENWTGALETSAFMHRRETLVVPPGAKGLWVSVSSAGPPNAVGIYAITNLVVTRLPTDTQPATTLLRWDSEAKGELTGSEWVPADWTRNGLRIGMAKITQFGPEQKIKALTLLDNDPDAHAEWTTRKEAAAVVSPGERLLLEWDEAFSIGLAGPAEVSYAELPAGFYRFRVNEMSLIGLPGGSEASLAFEVPLSFWHTPWFWGLVLLLFVSGAAGTYRYAVWQQMRRELARLESQRALEHERVRIARDIHDDLGARVTQISLVSGLAQGDHNLSEKARADFNAISGMARELVSALYETVWAVNPENDNLDALGNYVCQMVDNLCDKAQLPRRLRVAELPRDVQVSSHIRHNLVLAVKEAVHNVIKHAKASELSVFVDWEGTTLTIRIQDNGCGLDPATHAAGNGLANMQRRLEQAGGTCSFNSEPGRGTTVLLRTKIQSLR